MEDLIGRRLGHYRVVEKIGAGGMGVVFRALDERLDRDVAIKVLPEAVAGHVDRLARFEREAKLLASLSHQNIATLYGLEEHEGQLFLVMELAEGETLAERLTRGPVAQRDALEIAREIAEGIEAAHDKGIIHRDLKPSNVMLSPGGKVKVLDFGLAKAWHDEGVDSDLSDSPTLTAQMTAAGAVLGTAAYMSPEQACGQDLDKRSDIWAFGVVLWEMLVHGRLFEGTSASEIFASVLRSEPNWQALPADTPTLIRRLLRRCLQKDARQRLHDIGDARLDIEEALAEPDAGEQDAAPSADSRAMRSTWWMLPAAVAAGIVAASITWKMLMAPAGPPGSSPRLTVNMPPGISMHAHILRPGVAISPDGRWLVFVATEGGTRKLFRRSLEQFGVTSIPGTENAVFAFFSPDGRWVGFWDNVDDKLKKVALDGGAPVALCDTTNAWGATWGTNGMIVYNPGTMNGLWQVAETGGEPEQILAPIPETGQASFLMPEWLPDGSGVLFTAWNGGFTAASAQIVILDIASGETKVVLENAACARYLASGHLVFGRGGRAEVAPFDLERREVTGPSVPIPDPIFYEPGGKLHLAVSSTGTMAFVPGGSAPRRQLVLSDLRGNQEVVAGDQRGYVYPRFSPDGRRLAVVISEFGKTSIWILDRTTGLGTRMVGEGRRHIPLWSPDGRRVAFALETEKPPATWSIFWQEADASSSPEPLVMPQIAGDWLWPYSWTPDGKTLVFGKWSMGSSKDIYAVSVDNLQEVRPLVATAADDLRGLLSPDGRWIAYASNLTGHWAIYVQKFPDGSERQQVSPGDTDDLVGWAPDGRTIYYVREGQIMGVGITTVPALRADTPRVLFEVSYSPGVWYNPDVHLSADGERFVMVTKDETWGVATEIKVVLNWFEELNRLVPTGRP